MKVFSLLLQVDTTNFWQLNWYYVVAVTLSSIGIFVAIKNYLKKSSSSTNNTNTNSVTINLGDQAPKDAPAATEGERELDKLKKIVHILFIDDDTKFKVVKILTNTGWINTKSITDLKTYDDEILLRSDIVFVDVQGVGMILDCKDEGLGLALNIKTKYPKKKVIIYSAIPTHNVFHDAVHKVDFLLSKDAEPYEFITLIERFSKEIKV